MTDGSKKQKTKCTISEADTAAILDKYSPTTLLTLLQEIALNPSEKLDWNSLVQKTATGITNPREYQMLWRHIAYRSPLSDDIEDGAQPLDDDSDLECELETFPRASAEATSEAAACVKDIQTDIVLLYEDQMSPPHVYSPLIFPLIDVILVCPSQNLSIFQLLIASGSTSESNHLNNSTIEAPLIINVPSRRQPSEGTSETSEGTFITVPVFIQKQPHSTTPAEPVDPSGMIIRRKRKQWTLEEDEELKAAVKKCGEGNWTNILKEEYMAGRTASQLSQRWSILKKKDARLDVVGSSSDPRDSREPRDPRLSDVQQAARHAMSVALDGMKSREETNTHSTVKPAVPTGPLRPGSFTATSQLGKQNPSSLVGSSVKNAAVTSNPVNRLLPKNNLVVEAKKVPKVEAESNAQADIKTNPISSPALSKVMMNKATITGNKTENSQNTGEIKKTISPVLPVSKTEIQTTAGENSGNQSTKLKVPIPRSKNEAA
ncbi:hypothetical protein ACFE04_015777 [Oxalis oulophora]